MTSRYVWILATLLGFTSVAHAQTKIYKYEVGAQFAVMRFTPRQASTRAPIGIPECIATGMMTSRCYYSGSATYTLKPTISGLGGRFSYHLKSWLSLDGDINAFPDIAKGPVTPIGGPLESPYSVNISFETAFELRGGLRAGRRGEHTGFFAKARPGVLRFSSDAADCRPAHSAPCPTWKPGIDLGGVFEVYTGPRIITRFDVGDMLFRRQKVLYHNLEFTAGLGYRF